MRRLLWIVLLIGLVSSQAHSQARPIDFFAPFEGTLGAPGAIDSWSFPGREGGVVSLLVTGSGGLDSMIALRNSSGTILTSNDDTAYPDRNDSLLQAVTLPRIDTYTVNVMGFGTTTGDYTLTLLPGYAQLAERNGFDDDGSAWNIVDGDVTVENSGGTLRLSLEGNRKQGASLRTAAAQLSDFYAQSSFRIARGATGWRAGFALRHGESGYYALLLNERGAWRLDFVNADGTARQIRDWTAHPAIPAGETSFTLGVLANGAGFDVFYSGSYVGQAVDTVTPLVSSGRLGYALATPDALGSLVDVEIDSLVVTIPLTIDEADIVPSELITGGQSQIIQELERRRVIPPGGTQALTVAESSGRQLEPGVNRVLLGRGATFGDVVLHTQFMLVPATREALVGCGLLLANVSDTQHAVAFLDQRGGYGISARDGDNYSPGLFGEDPALISQGRHSLILIRRGADLTLFVDSKLVGSSTLPDTLANADGQIGNAVINYERADTVCEFSDTWVWSLP